MSSNSEIAGQLLQMSADALETVLSSILPHLPVEHLVRLAEDVEKALTAKSPQEQVHDAEDAIEEENDALEYEDLK